MKILVDAFGGDNAPEEIVAGAVAALAENKEITLGLTGDKEKTEKVLSALSYDKSRVEVIDAPSVITCEEEPTLAIRRKTDSSMVVAFSLLRENQADALVSAGSSGALLVGSTLKVGRIKGVNRPALCPALPNVYGGQTLLCDCGANLDCKPIHFAHFAIMASAYAKAAFGVAQPKVGLLNNGAEAHKGDEVHRAAYRILSNMECVNFAGNVEGRELMYGDYDVIVSDGFSGNTALKAIEGCGKTVQTVLKEAATRNIFTKLGALCAWGTIGKLKSMLDYHKYGGSVFLGLKKIVIKSHGSSKGRTICASVLKAAEAHCNHLTQTIEEMLSSVDLAAIEEKCREENV